MHSPRWTTLVLLCLATATAQAQSLAPPHAPLEAGKAVPVTPHPDQRQLLQSAVPELAVNKRTVFDYWRRAQVAGQVDAVDEFVAQGYIEHNPLLPTGRDGLKRTLAAREAQVLVPDTIPDLVTMVAEGPWVAMALVTHYPEPDGSGLSYSSTHFELFRLEAGLIAEHWDSTLFRAGQVVPEHGAEAALPVVGVAGVAQLDMVQSNDPQLFMNKRLVFDIWRHMPEGGREETAVLYMDPIYIQHNPNAATGRAGVQEYFSRRPDTAIETTLEAPLVALFAEGDMVVQVLETERVQNGVTYKVPWFDMFRIADGLAIEHWDTASKGELPAIFEEGAQ
jgi:predicted SnoaL-like aldol condensation-catalyzing enzyme